jgi:hypothetical protein
MFVFQKTYPLVFFFFIDFETFSFKNFQYPFFAQNVF